MKHKDANKVYLYPKPVKEKPSEYGYRIGFREYFITYKGNDLQMCKTMKEVQDRLRELRSKE